MAEVGLKEGLQVLLPVILICESHEAHPIGSVYVQEEHLDNVGLAYKEKFFWQLYAVVLESCITSVNVKTFDSVEIDL